MLTIIATPIGNLQDITLRSLETLKNVDGIICEDTRVTSKLLNHYQIKKPLIALNDFNEYKIYPILIERLKSGENLALVSDAGTPLVSDPGFKLVRECLRTGIKVDSLPGPSAVITALTISGLPPDKFLFLGYPPDKPGHRQDLYTRMQQISKVLPMTFIVYVAPFKIVKSLTEMQQVFGDIEITLEKELTKIYQDTQTKLISEFLEQFKSKPPKGEFVLLLRI